MPSKKLSAGVGAALGLLILGGCASVEQRDPLLPVVLDGADKLSAQLSKLDRTGPIIVASAQSNDELAKVCPQGRVISEIVSSRLTQNGFPITELRLSNRLQVSAEGETLLSREVKDLAAKQKADVVVTSTWTALEGRNSNADTTTLYVTIKAVRFSDGLVLGSQSLAIPGANKTCVQSPARRF